MVSSRASKAVFGSTPVFKPPRGASVARSQRRLMIARQKSVETLSPFKAKA